MVTEIIQKQLRSCCSIRSGSGSRVYAVGKSRRNISDLMDIRPDYANIERDGKLEQVDPDEVGNRFGDRRSAGRKGADRRGS